MEFPKFLNKLKAATTNHTVSTSLATTKDTISDTISYKENNTDFTLSSELRQGHDCCLETTQMNRGKYAY